jgi:hypothetical protein
VGLPWKYKLIWNNKGKNKIVGWQERNLSRQNIDKIDIVKGYAWDIPFQTKMK